MKLSSLPSCLVLALLPTLAAASPSYKSQHEPKLIHAADMTAGTYPRAIRLADNSLLGTVTQFSPSKDTTSLLALKSTNDGEWWSAIGTIDTATTSAHDLDNAYPLQVAADGHILAVFRNHDRAPDGGFSWYRITLTQSTDGGSTWEYVTQIWESGNPDPSAKTGAWEPFMRLASGYDTTVQMYYSKETSTADQNIMLSVSSDTSYTSWSPAVTVTGSTLATRDGMLGVAELDGRLYMVFESQPTGHFMIFMVEDGATWENRRIIVDPTCSAAAGKTCHAGAPQIANVGGRLVVSFMTDEDGPYGSWPSGASAKMIVSVDKARSWSAPTTVAPSGSMWPGLLALDDDSFLYMYQNSRGTAVASRYSLA